MASIIKSDNGVSSGITGIVQSADSSGQLVLQTTTSSGTATTAVTIDNTQKVTFANSIGFGSNAGITFNNSSATVNSTLNDYETGTWTPAIADNGNGAAWTATSQVGTYVKIGKMVTIWCYYAWSSQGSAAGGDYAFMSGLPFIPNNSSGSTTPIRIGTTFVFNAQSSNDARPWSAAITNSSYFIGFDISNNSASPGYLTSSQFASSGSLNFTMTYQATF